MALSTHPQPSGPRRILRSANSDEETRFPLASMGQRLASVWGGSATARPGHPDKAFAHPARGAAPKMPLTPARPPPRLLTNTLASPPAQHRGLGGGPGREFCGVSPQTGPRQETPKEIFNIGSEVGAEGRAVIFSRSFPIPAQLPKQALCDEGLLSYTSL